VTYGTAAVPMPAARSPSASTAGATIATAPAAAVRRPCGRSSAYATGTITTTTEAGTSTDKNPLMSAISPIANKLAAIAVNSRLPSLTSAASSSSKGRSLRGSYRS